ncbi:putative ABC transport system permease protein [Lentzea xinjiangensis]|uniref:Putative ABC transport system permease protein n=1 Tax=Lentzea xinjiangensis TaxID=402600 RepID=A0A1H9RC98_9PSEU|nr:FtsX-like permease family protein [Lentzea xinjiangensis]SER69553.1 putative ABC transport system permease protein [Lentzea xinjiangensis]
MNGWRAALRIAWREARRSRGRSALVVAMILIPVAALTFAAVVHDSTELTPDEDATRLMGASEAMVRWPHRGPVIQQPDQLFAVPDGESTGPEPSEDGLRALLPGAELIPLESTGVNIRTTAGVGRAGVRMVDMTNPLTQGIVTVLEGRAATGTTEVALSRTAMDRTGARIGGTITTEDGRVFTVVGLVEEPGALENTTIVTVPGAFPGADRIWLVTTPLNWAEVKELNKSGVVALSRAVLRDPPSAAERYTQLGESEELRTEVLVLIAGLAVLEVALLAGSALAVGARRRKRDLALVAAVGGAPSHVRRIVLADGVVLGAVAALGGVALGTLAAVAGRPVIEWALEERFGAQRFYPEALAALGLLAVVTGVLAAVVPAWISARQDVVTALAGRRGITRSRRRWLVLGLALVAAGVAIGAFSALQVEVVGILVALIVTEVGLVLCTPALLGLLARAGRRLPVALRMALRDASRNRTAAAPAISAVMAAVIGAVAVSVVLTSQAEQAAGQLAGSIGDVSVYPRDDLAKAGTTAIPPSVATAVRDTMPTAELHEIKLLSCDGRACMAHVRPPAARQCPYSLDVLRREPTEAEERAALQDRRCDGEGRAHRYFGAFTTTTGFLAVTTPDAVGTLLRLSPADAAQAQTAMREGKVVVNTPDRLENGTALIATRMQSATTTAPAHAVPAATAPLALMTEDTARALGFPVTSFTLYAKTTRMPTTAEQDALTAALGGEYEVHVDRPTETATQRYLGVLALVAGLITLAAAALATGLAAADGRRDLTTLAAVGATPALRKLLSLSQAGVIAGIGGVLGTTAGVGSALALLAAFNVGYASRWPQQPLNPLTIPWPNVLTSLLVVPAVAMLGAALFTRSRLPVERRE